MLNNFERAVQAINKASKLDENRSPSIVIGTIKKIDDPLQQLRCKVVLEYFSQQSTSQQSTSQQSTSQQNEVLTDWIPFVDTRKGLLPSELLNTKVLLYSVNNSWENLIFVGPQVWRFDALPPTAEENLGWQIYFESNGEGFLMICTRRNNQIIWEKLSPLSHLHRGGDYIQQGIDAGGNVQQIIKPECTHDNVVVTSVKKYYSDSKNFPPSLS